MNRISRLCVFCFLLQTVIVQGETFYLSPQKTPEEAQALYNQARECEFPASAAENPNHGLDKALPLYANSAFEGNTQAALRLYELMYCSYSGVYQPKNNGNDKLRQDSLRITALCGAFPLIKDDDLGAIRLLKAKAKSGDSTADCALAWRLLGNSRGNADDFKALFQRFQSAQKNGLTAGTLGCAECYLRGIGVEQNFPKAIELYEKAAREGEYLASIQLAKLCFWGIYKKELDVEKRDNLTVSLIQNALHISELEARRLICNYLHHAQSHVILPLNQERDFFLSEYEALRFRWTKRTAELGDGECLYSMAFNYIQGTCVKKDVNQGIALLIKSAENGYSSAYLALGELYQTGVVIPCDYVKAREYFQKAFNAGLSYEAMQNLVAMQLIGQGCEKMTFAQVKRWTKEFSSQGKLNSNAAEKEKPQFNVSQERFNDDYFWESVYGKFGELIWNPDIPLQDQPEIEKYALSQPVNQDNEFIDFTCLVENYQQGRIPLSRLVRAVQWRALRLDVPKENTQTAFTNLYESCKDFSRLFECLLENPACAADKAELVRWRDYWAEKAR